MEDLIALCFVHDILGQLFCDGSATQIVSLLLRDMAAAGVDLWLGCSLGEFFVARATGGSVRLRGFDSARFVEADGSPKDFKLSDPLDAGAYSVSGPAIALPKADTLAWLWQEALKEWA